MTNNYRDSYYKGNLLFRLCTYTTASPAIFLRKEHGLTVNDRVQFDSDDTMPTGVSKDTWYFVISTALDSDNFEISTSKAGSATNITVSGSGQFYFATDKPSRLGISTDSNQ